MLFSRRLLIARITRFFNNFKNAPSKTRQALEELGEIKPYFSEKCPRNAISVLKIGILSTELRVTRLKTIEDCARFGYRSGQ